MLRLSQSGGNISIGCGKKDSHFIFRSLCSRIYRSRRRPKTPTLPSFYSNNITHLGAYLIATLAGLKVDNFSHFGCRFSEMEKKVCALQRFTVMWGSGRAWSCAILRCHRQHPPVLSQRRLDSGPALQTLAQN